MHSLSDFERELAADPALSAQVDRLIRNQRRAERLTNPLGFIPLAGGLARVFWLLVLTEGDPRGGLIFSYLNDGMRPTLWHTALQMFRPDGHPDVGIWPGRAPRSRADAQALRAHYRVRSARVQ
jgi:hypothetical protein